jgi:ABC-type amino acid transport substrate-binding protein
MGVRKGNDELRETVNSAIARIKSNGRLEAIWTKWLPELRYPF